MHNRMWMLAWIVAWMGIACSSESGDLDADTATDDVATADTGDSAEDSADSGSDTADAATDDVATADTGDSADSGSDTADTATDDVATADTGDSVDSGGDTADTETDTGAGVQVAALAQYATARIQATFSGLAANVPGAPDFSPLVQSDVQFARLEYPVEYGGEVLTASALVAVPLEGASGGVPVISFQNGTNTMYDEAPTKNWEDPYIQAIGFVAALGYAVVIPDYLGFGASEQVFHPYLCKAPTQDAVLGALEGLDVAQGDPLIPELADRLFLVGYSEGGYATLAAFEALQHHAPPFAVSAVAAGAGPYALPDVYGFVAGSDTYPMPFFAPYTLLAFESAGYWTGDVAAVFQDPYADAVYDLFDFAHDGASINAGLTTDMGALFTQAARTRDTSVADIAALEDALAANAIAPHAVPEGVALRLYHGTADAYIPMSVSETAYQAYRDATVAAGGMADQVQLIPLPGATHEQGAPVTVFSAIAWFNELSGVGSAQN